MKQSLRHQKIIDLVNQYGYLSTEDLVSRLEVSPPTVRRDLNILAVQLRLLRRKIPIISIANNFSLRKKTALHKRW